LRPPHTFPTRRPSDLHHGCDIQHNAAMQISQARQRAALCEKRVCRLARRRPRLHVPRMLHFADDVEAPILYALVLKTECLEGDRSEEHTSELQSPYDL